MARFAAALLLVLVCPVLAQESPSYKMSEHVFNAGGHPANGAIPASASYRMTLEAVGESITRAGLQGPSHHMDAGFGVCYPPPDEVHGLWFSDHDTLNWAPEKSVGDYALYRDLVGSLDDGSYGACEQHGLAGASAVDAAPPPVGQGFFYLVTARNRLREEGTKGRDSDGLERANPGPCP